MRKGILGCSLALCCGLLIAGGCAKQEVVKKEEPIAAPAPQPAATTPAPQAPTAPQAETAAPTPAPKEQPVPKETAAAVKEEPAATTSQASLQDQLEKIYFAFDSSELTSVSRDSLKKNYDLLKKNGGVKVRIEGNCDERGSDEYNLALGERRAKSAMKYLVTLGVKADRISTLSYGKEKPLDPGHDEAAWAKNRRDDFIIVK
jgi:peptidoglycan-associated lipoprotein